MDHIFELVLDLIVSLLTVLNAVMQSFIKNFDDPSFKGFQVGRLVVLVSGGVGVGGSDDLAVREGGDSFLLLWLIVFDDAGAERLVIIISIDSRFGFVGLSKELVLIIVFSFHSIFDVVA